MDEEIVEVLGRIGKHAAETMARQADLTAEVRTLRELTAKITEAEAQPPARPLRRFSITVDRYKASGKWYAASHLPVIAADVGSQTRTFDGTACLTDPVADFEAVLDKVRAMRWVTEWRNGGGYLVVALDDSGLSKLLLPTPSL